MRSQAVLVLLIFVGSAICWWPLLIEPNLDLPWWLPPVCVGLCAGLSTILCPTGWRWPSVSSAAGTLAGLSVGYSIWWPTDPIAGPWVPITVAVATALAGLVAFVAGLAVRRVRLPTATSRRAVWLVLVGCVVSGPVALAFTQPLVAHRVKVNDQIAAKRFESLRSAVQQTAKVSADKPGVCDGMTLKAHYSGPRFSGEAWKRITANYVKEDGYIFMVYCREQGGYTIDARPSRDKGDGTRLFCTDESGRVGCGMNFNGSRHACEACAP